MLTFFSSKFKDQVWQITHPSIFNLPHVIRVNSLLHSLNDKVMPFQIYIKVWSYQARDATSQRIVNISFDRRSTKNKKKSQTFKDLSWTIHFSQTSKPGKWQIIFPKFHRPSKTVRTLLNIVHWISLQPQNSPTIRCGWKTRISCSSPYHKGCNLQMIKWFYWLEMMSFTQDIVVDRQKDYVFPVIEKKICLTGLFTHEEIWRIPLQNCLNKLYCTAKTCAKFGQHPPWSEEKAHQPTKQNKMCTPWRTANPLHLYLFHFPFGW